jgi:hypothetical protein
MQADEIDLALTRTADTLDVLRPLAVRALERAERRGDGRGVVTASCHVRRIDRARATLRERPPGGRSGGTPPSGRAPPGDTHAVTVHHNTPVVKKAP